MLFSPLRDNGITGPYLRFEPSSILEIYKALFLKTFTSDCTYTTHLPVAMPSTDSSSTTATPVPEVAPPQTPTESNGNSEAMPAATESTESAQPKGKEKGKGPGSNAQASKPAKALTPAAEAKRKKQEEKAARRAQAVAAKEVESAPIAAEASQAGPSTTPNQHPQQNAATQKVAQNQQRTAKANANFGGSRSLPVRSVQKVSAPVVPKKEDKTVEIFRHLYKPRNTSIAGVNKDVHPAVLALGLQMANYTICGSCARLVAMLQAFKRVSYYPNNESNIG